MRLSILVLGTVLVLRAVFLEPFTVPTGSMASEIVGRHVQQDCPSCGWTVRIGEPGDGAPVNALQIDCPNCGAALDLANLPQTKGDRVLVDKTAFDWRTPRRWEVIVFRGPDDPDRPYLKRVVGLPGETVSLRDGDVYIDGELIRKSPAEVRAMSRPVFDMSHVPTDGWASRWMIEPPGSSTIEGDELHFDASHKGPSTLTWLTPHGEPVRDREAYNGRPFDIGNEPVHDFLVSFEIRFAGSPEGTVLVSLSDGADTARFLIDFNKVSVTVDGRASAQQAASFPDGEWHFVELAFVDRKATLCVDHRDAGGRLKLTAPDGERPGVVVPVTLQSNGLSASIRKLRLDRDLHYGRTGRNGQSQSRLGPDEYYVLGDNSGNSEDSRFWSKPGVRSGDLIGKALLIHAPHRWRHFSLMGRSWDWQLIDTSRFGWIR